MEQYRLGEEFIDFVVKARGHDFARRGLGRSGFTPDDGRNQAAAALAGPHGWPGYPPADGPEHPGDRTFLTGTSKIDECTLQLAPVNAEQLAQRLRLIQSVTACAGVSSGTELASGNEGQVLRSTVGISQHVR